MSNLNVVPATARLAQAQATTDRKKALAAAVLNALHGKSLNDAEETLKRAGLEGMDATVMGLSEWPEKIDEYELEQAARYLDVPMTYGLGRNPIPIG